MAQVHWGGRVRGCWGCWWRTPRTSEVTSGGRAHTPWVMGADDDGDNGGIEAEGGVGDGDVDRFRVRDGDDGGVEAEAIGGVEGGGGYSVASREAVV
jgi:hypothetical protein